jgi:hypothetical protein
MAPTLRVNAGNPEGHEFTPRSLGRFGTMVWLRAAFRSSHILIVEIVREMHRGWLPASNLPGEPTSPQPNEVASANLNRLDDVDNDMQERDSGNNAQVGQGIESKAKDLGHTVT